MSELIFDKYEILNRLAVGGMGEVFYAVQRGAVRGFERPVILKNLLPDLASQDGFIEQFLDEARVAATLNHPNVVSIYEVGLWNGVYFIAMEFIRGRNLSQLIKTSLKKNLPIPPAVIARVVHDAALGLDHAHVAKDGHGQPLNIVHRDVSPQNIMVREDGVTKVVDFGIARAANRSTRTATGAVKGKLAYMAPEQVASRNIDGGADQFALGVVLWEMCTRRRLFQAERDIDLIKKVLEGDIPKPSSVVSGLPEDLDEIVLKMTQREPEKRYPNVAEVARELETFLMKFSPPSSESPVATYMRSLGTEDLSAVPAKATPSAQNFVISLKGEKIEKPNPDAIPTATTPSVEARRQASEVRRKGRKWFLAAAIAASVLFVGGGILVAMESPPATPVVEPPVEVSGEKPVVKDPAQVADPQPVPQPRPKRPGKLIIASAPSGAWLRINGRKSGETPQTIELSAGEPAHLQLDKPGYAVLEQDVTVQEGEERRVDFKLVKRSGGGTGGKEPQVVQPPPTVTTNEPGFISISTEPWTKVTVDGDPWGSTPIFKKKLTVGKHTVVMEAESGKTLTRSVDIKSGEVTKLNVEVK